MVSLFGGGSKPGNVTTNAVPQSNVQLFQSAQITMSAATQQVTQNQIKNPNGLPMHNLNIDFNITETTGTTTAPATVTTIDTAFTNLTITGASGKQLMNINPSSGDPLRKLQHRFNNNGYYNTPPGGPDTTVATQYVWDYLVLLQNWVIYPEEFPLTVQFTVNTQASRATTVNNLVSLAQVTFYADFVPLARALPRTVVRVKPVTGIAAADFDFMTYLDTAPLLDVSLDVGADTKLNATNTFNILVNNNPIVANSAYQNVTNRENLLYPITTLHIPGYFPLNVLNGMRTLTPNKDLDSVQANFAQVPTASGTNGQANLDMIESY